jgi:hypothetical protein
LSGSCFYPTLENLPASGVIWHGLSRLAVKPVALYNVPIEDDQQMPQEVNIADN